MSYQVFVSYAREDEELCLRLYRLLTERFGLRVYRDLDRAHAGNFPNQIRAALLTDPQPVLAVLASDAAVASDWVADEIQIFQSHHSNIEQASILVLQIDAGAMESLGLEDFQMIDLNHHLQQFAPATVDRLWLALHGAYALGKYNEARSAATLWCEEILGTLQVDFWGETWRLHVRDLLGDAPIPCALTAGGGSGKSVVAAHMVRHLLQTDSQCMPVVISQPQDLEVHEVHQVICRSAGAWSLNVLTEHVERLKARGNRVYFLIDGLDRIGRTREIHEAFVEVLAQLAQAGSLLVTCRTEVWNDDFAQLGLKTVTVDDLPAERVDAIVAQAEGISHLALMSILQVPFFLDAFLQVRQLLTDTPTCQTDLLDALWNKYLEPVGGAVPRHRETEAVLTMLAELQVTSMSFAVPLEYLVRELAPSPATDDDIDDLRKSRILVQTVMGMTRGVRLRHDLLDCFGMVKVLVDEARGNSSRRSVYGRISEDVGWQLVSSLVQHAHDRRDNGLLEEIFTELLRVLDKKSLGAVAMPDAWAATYILRNQFGILLPYILDCLEGRKVPSIDSAADVRRRSNFGPNATITRETASSLASVFDAIDDWPSSYPDRAIPALKMNLSNDRWPSYRRRFVEALAKYYTSEAKDALEELAREELRSLSDVSLLGDVAAALGKVGTRDTSVPLLDQIISVLRKLAAGLGSDAEYRQVRVDASRAMRAAIKARNRKGRSTLPLSPVFEEEIIHNLRPCERSPESNAIRYTDWKCVEEGAHQAQKWLASGKFSTSVMNALIEALDHEHSHARAAVVASLAKIDRPNAREAILAAVLEGGVSAEVQRACLNALRQQLEKSKTSSVRALRRWFILRAADQADVLSLQILAGQLRALCFEETLADGLLLDANSFEVLDTAGEYVSILGVRRDVPVSVEAQVLIAASDRRAVGSNWESKYRVSSWASSGAGQATVSFAATSWREGAGFHRALKRMLKFAPEHLDELLERWLDGSVQLPGIGVVHGVIVTSDNQVVLAKRGSQTTYSPDRWSASFEEQLVDQDFIVGKEDVAGAAAKRGLSEEFGSDISVTATNMLGLIVEMPIANLAIVVLVHVEQTFEELRLCGSHTASAQNDETVELQSVVASVGELGNLIESRGKMRFHPTSLLRLKMLRRRLVEHPGG